MRNSINPTITLLHSHRSDRSFTQQTVDDSQLDAIIQSAYLAPTSVNSQQVSVIVTRDPQRKARIAELAGNQPWIAQAPVFLTLVLDMYKTQQGIALADQQQIAHESVESLISGATDVGIALASMMIAARAFGLGIVPIGGIRKAPKQLIELLSLPAYCFPVVGLTLGHIDHSAAQKPRLPICTFRHDGHYDPTPLTAAITEYNQTLSQHWQDTGRSDGLPWGINTAQYYQHIYFPDVLPALLQQGFKLDK